MKRLDEIFRTGRVFLAFLSKGEKDEARFNHMKEVLIGKNIKSYCPGLQHICPTFPCKDGSHLCYQKN